MTIALLNKEPRLPRKCKKAPQSIPIKISTCELPDWLQSEGENEEKEFEGFTLEEVTRDCPMIEDEKEKYEKFYEEFEDSDYSDEEFDGFQISDV